MKNSFVNYEIVSNYKELSPNVPYLGIYNLFKEVNNLSKEEHLTSKNKSSMFYRQKRRKWK